MHALTRSAETPLGVWLIEDLHRVSCSVGKLTYQALLYLSVYPLIHAVVSAFSFGIMVLWAFKALFFVVVVTWWCTATA